MKQRPHRQPVSPVFSALLLFAVLAVAACGSESTGPQGPASISIAGGNEQVGSVADELNSAISITVFDHDGLTYEGAAVTWAVIVGGGSVEPTSSVTNNVGRASTAWTLGTTAGPQRATATVTGITPVTFTATAEPAPPSQIVITPATAVISGVGATTTLSAELQDEYGNPIADPDFDWSSSDEGVARVDSDGVVTGWGVGTATITASDQGASGTATVTVQEGQD